MSDAPTTHFTLMSDDPEVLRKLAAAFAGVPADVPVPETPIATELFEEAAADVQRQREDQAHTVGHEDGWNGALDYARDEILENLDRLVKAYRADGQTAVMDLIDQRISELKK